MVLIAYHSFLWKGIEEEASCEHILIASYVAPDCPLSAGAGRFDGGSESKPDDYVPYQSSTDHFKHSGSAEDALHLLDGDFQ